MNNDLHVNALSLNFKHVDKDNYELPSNWGKEGIIVDLSASGIDQLQIVKSCCQQLISIITSMDYVEEIIQSS